MTEQGKIIKLLGGFYYIQDQEGKVEESRARGVFRHQKQKPLVGDCVRFSRGEGEELSYVEEILPRKNSLLRPPVANIDQLLLFVPIRFPNYNLYLVDKMIAHYESLEIEVIVVISKADLDLEAAESLRNIYKKAGFSAYLLSENNQEMIEEIKKILFHKTTALAGVSGAGKSTFVNSILDLELETQSVSKKLNRGKHTTRHTELMMGEEGILLFDTPGFSSMDLEEVESTELDELFREFLPFKKQCKFMDCHHINEPKCGVREALKEGEITESRYENYVKIYEELVEKERERWR